jgi:hypothetical protein
MKARRLIIATLATGMLLAAAVPTASAHATAYSADGKFKFVYGNLNEPAYTFTKTGLDLTISDNATGKPISGLESVDHAGKLNPKIQTWFLYAGQELELTNGFKAQFGQPGKYTYPITYTKAGSYALRIKGTINGTAVDQTIQPAHGVESIDTIMWPEKVSTQDQLEKRIEDLEAQVVQLKSSHSNGSVGGGKAPGVDAVALVALLGVAVVLVRRRSA